jgi:CheY-like chemotaxis protein/anti-sigma regulatory factor (Ser/Thr protein kinase)
MARARRPEEHYRMPRALIVDDSKTDRLMIGGLLEKESGLEVAYATNGAEGLAMIEADEPDLVITDLVMPEMDGLELVSEISTRFQLVPVILVTSQGSEETAVKALQLGAASYVPKRALATDLVETVDVVLSSAAQQRCRSELMESMTKSESLWKLPNDRRLFGPLVSFLQETLAGLGLLGEAERTRVGVALEEALVNAAEHGNLDVDSSLRSQDRAAYMNLVKERLHTPPYSERRIHLEVRLTADEASFVVRDEGKGFDPSSLPDPRDPENLLKVSGRGVLIMRTFMDEARFNSTGNEVTLIKRCSPPAEEPAS